jgi:type IV secretory pathway VirB10-like protein
MRNLKNCFLIGGLSAVIAGAGLSGCSYNRARESGRTPTQMADDKQISDRVISSLKVSPVYKFPNVGVRTFDRVVQLNGFVMTEEQKRAAEEIAQEAPGALRVINDIVVQQQPPPEPTPTGRPNEPAPPPPNQPNPSAPRNQSGS